MWRQRSDWCIYKPRMPRTASNHQKVEDWHKQIFPDFGLLASQLWENTSSAVLSHLISVFLRASLGSWYNTQTRACAQEQNVHEGTWASEFHKPRFKLCSTEYLHYDTEQVTYPLTPTFSCKTAIIALWRLTEITYNDQNLPHEEFNK